jgi:Lipase (class 3)
MTFVPGFIRQEALDLLAMCANVEGEVAAPIPVTPPGWTLLFDSPVIGAFDEKWQLWRSDAGGYAVVLRGTVMKVGSVLEDLISVLVWAQGHLTVGHQSIAFQFAAEPAAGVHLGFALGTLVLLKDPINGILAQLAQHGVTAGANVYLTGHSQGAAMATLLRSYLEYAPDGPRGLSYKTYVFAQPKPGNDHYATDCERLFSNPGLAFRVTNSLDWVPQVPFTLELVRDINHPNPLSVLASPSLLLSALMKVMEPLVSEARRLIEHHSRPRLQRKAAALAQRVAPSSTPAPAAPFDAPFHPSLNFVNAGTEEALIGVPCVGAECDDAFFEHHVTTYYTLVQAQVP